jgi:putative PIN family toxin of toxin-antitoxin system
MKAVLDTMMWVSCCTRRDGFRHRFIKRARRARVRLFVSAYILDELGQVLTEDLNLSRRYAILARRAVLRLAKLVSLPPNIGPWVPADRDDDPIVQTAISAGADYLVTADREILKLKKLRGVEIITADDFHRLLPPDE